MVRAFCVTYRTDEGGAVVHVGVFVLTLEGSCLEVGVYIIIISYCLGQHCRRDGENSLHSDKITKYIFDTLETRYKIIK